MANNCDFHMKIHGRKDDCKELADLLADGIGRVYLCQVVDEGPGWLEVAGDCAWSVRTAILEPEGGRFAEELARLDLAVELFGSEPGMQFQEHYVVDRGDVLVEEEVDYGEYWVEGMDEKELADLAEELGLTRDYLIENANEKGDYCVGGFESWDFSYVPSPSKLSVKSLARDFARFAATDGARDLLRDYFPYGLEGMDENEVRSLLENSLSNRSFKLDMGQCRLVVEGADAESPYREVFVGLEESSGEFQDIAAIGRDCYGDGVSVKLWRDPACDCYTDQVVIERAFAGREEDAGEHASVRKDVASFLLQGRDFYNVLDGRTVMPYLSESGYGRGVETPAGEAMYGFMTKTVEPDEARKLGYDVGMYCRETFPAPDAEASDRLGFVNGWRYEEMIDRIANEDGWCLADPKHVAEAFAALDAKREAGERSFLADADMAEAASKARDKESERFVFPSRARE